MKFEADGERFIPGQSNSHEILVNLDRYMMAIEYCVDADVLELGCGSGLGTYLYSLVAKSIVAIDYASDAFAHAKLYPIDPYKVSFREMNLEKEFP